MKKKPVKKGMAKSQKLANGSQGVGASSANVRGKRAPGRRKTRPVRGSAKPKRAAKPKRTAGRPVNYTPAIGAAIASLVGTGMRPTPAGAKLGVAAQTLSGWRKNVPGFEQLLEKADADFLETLITRSRVIIASDDNMAAAGAHLRFMLERRFPAEFGPRIADVTVNTNINAPVVLTAAQLEALQAKRRESLHRK